MAKSSGKIVQILGGVVDVEFPPDELPEIFDALEIPQENGKSIILEVEKHIGNNWVRCVAMDSTDGLKRGMLVHSLGKPISVPVGINTLGRVFNVIR
jgi:F-type H+-transporting ATPase subunit beta